MPKVNGTRYKFVVVVYSIVMLANTREKLSYLILKRGLERRVAYKAYSLKISDFVVQVG